MNNGSIFFQHPMGLWGAEPYCRLAADMGPLGKGIYWDIFEQIRLGRGIDSLDHLLTLYDSEKNIFRRRSLQDKLRRILSPEYNLFIVNAQGMVTIIDHSKKIREENRRALEEGPTLFDDFWKEQV